MEISFLLITKNEGNWLRHTLHQLLRKFPQRSEVIVLDDGSTDGSTDFLQRSTPLHVRFLHTPGLGVARARNAAALQARGRTLVFLDAHMNLTEGWWEPVIELLAHPSVGAAQPCIADINLEGARGYGERFQGADLTLEWLPARSANPYPIPILCGCCFAVRRNLFIEVGGLDGGMIGWGSEDCEFSIRLWRLGYEIWIDPQVVIGHLFRKNVPYRIEWSVVLYNRLRLAIAHFSESRVERVVQTLRSLPDFRQAYAELASSDVLSSRRWLSQNCLRNDDWFLACSGKTF
jgi:glycosyltransferase involved in cell wall biosynthesis